MKRLSLPGAAIPLECSIEMSFVTVSYHLLMIWATSLGFALLSCRDVCFFPIIALKRLKDSS